MQTQKPGAVEPAIIEDGGYSIEPVYWLTSGHMYLKGGATSTGIKGLSYPGHSKASYGGELSYTWDKPAGKIRMKTLFEVQYVNVSTATAAPLKAVTTDSSGNTNDNTATGSKFVVWPTLGVEFEQTLANRLRWQVKASGFGIPDRADIWDAAASIAYRIKSCDVADVLWVEAEVFRNLRHWRTAFVIFYDAIRRHPRTLNDRDAAHPVRNRFSERASFPKLGVNYRSVSHSPTAIWAIEIF